LRLTRRRFLQQASAATLLSGAASSFAQQSMHDHMAMQAPARAAIQPTPRMLLATSLTPFVDPLPLPKRIHAGHTPVQITMREVHAKLHRDVPPTRLWTYVDATGASTNVAPLIEARSGSPLRVEWHNQLPAKHFLPVDFSLHGCGRDLPEVRAIVHLHGARVDSASDGYPEDWFVSGHSRTCTYPMQQESAALWYHDHAMGLNRLNTYAGMFGMVLVRDEFEDSLQLPRGAQELPLTLADRLIAADGQLFYPTSGDAEHPWVPEFYGDSILVNGKIAPYVEVEPRLYRLRILNAANSRFFSLALSNKQPLHLIGADQGLFDHPAAVPTTLLAPAERADILVDFSGSAGQHVELLNGIVGIMQFRVGNSSTSASAVIPSQLRPRVAMPESSAVLTRTITLNEAQDKAQNPMLMTLNHKRWHEPVTEQPRLNTTEIWEFVNLTEDTHPMHLHLVRFQVLDRRTFDVFQYRVYNKLKFLAGATLPEPHESGWKDVVQCPPGMITRIIVRFEGYPGKYLYHCHVLEHEANDMMRPFEVIA